MPIRIKLQQGESLSLNVDLGDWNRAFQHALANNEMLEVHDPNGRVLAINPHQVVYLEEVPEEVPAADPTRQAQPA